jgi:hypothetical protein
MTESTREKDVNQPTRRELAVVERENESGAVHAQGVPQGEK